MREEKIEITIVNHVGVDVDCDPARIWALILSDYRDGMKFRNAGYSLTPLTDDPAAIHGGYRMAFGPDAEDPRICRVTELDEQAMRLSMRAEYGATADDMTVYASYRARSNPAGARYEVDSHASLRLLPSKPGSEDTISATVADLTRQFDAALSAYLEAAKDCLERVT